MKNTPFLQELVEGRIYRDGSTVRGKSAEQIADLVFLMFMLLEIMRFEDKGFAKDYANAIVKWQEFNSMKHSANDMYNLLAVLSNQDTYDAFIGSNHAIAIPTLQLFRYLRDLTRDTQSHNLDRQFLAKLEDFLKVTKYKSIRRIVADWSSSTDSERKGVLTTIHREFQAKGPQTDIYTGSKNHIKL
jgi:hypothetical protein